MIYHQHQPLLECMPDSYMVFENTTFYLSPTWFSFSTSFKVSAVVEYFFLIIGILKWLSWNDYPEIIILKLLSWSSTNALLVEVVSNSDSPVWDFEIPKPIISQSRAVSGDIFVCQTKYKTFAHRFYIITTLFWSGEIFLSSLQDSFLESFILYLKFGVLYPGCAQTFSFSW